MDLYEKYLTDEVKEIEGVWIPMSPTARIKVARMYNSHYRECIRRLSVPYKVVGLAGQVPDDIYQGMVRQAVAETILVDWHGITSGGQPVPYTKENALKYCTELKDFYAFVVSAADNMENFRVNGQAVLVGNS